MTIATQSSGYKTDKYGKFYECIMTSTAYSYSGSLTASGTVPKRGTIAVDNYQIKFGTKMYVENYGWGFAEDTGGAIVGQKIDLFMDTVDECYNWGRRDVNVRIYIK
jgi:3D (Asp-Asp-Asp) domain-containing protein